MKKKSENDRIRRIERQMKAYVKQEEYDEMLKLIKVSVLPNPLPALPAY
jgi:hypothetical protein